MRRELLIFISLVLPIFLYGCIGTPAQPGTGNAMKDAFASISGSVPDSVKNAMHSTGWSQSKTVQVEGCLFENLYTGSKVHFGMDGVTPVFEKLECPDGATKNKGQVLALKPLEEGTFTTCDVALTALKKDTDNKIDKDACGYCYLTHSTFFGSARHVHVQKVEGGHQKVGITCDRLRTSSWKIYDLKASHEEDICKLSGELSDKFFVAVEALCKGQASDYFDAQGSPVAGTAQTPGAKPSFFSRLTGRNK